MPSLAATVTVSSETEITLKPQVRRKLLAELRSYQELKSQRDAIDEQMGKKKVAIGAIRESTGEQSIALEGFKVTEVRGVTSKLDKKRFVQLGGSLTMLEEATVTTPKRPYDLVTVPGEKERE